ncbi:hypothetical protein CNMCM6936_001974 [Aspergillus lentulus]|nr:hypothetical protein CNMCM6936_001974 [Aspergillus lentulus]
MLFKYLIGRPCLLSLFCSPALAAPVDNLADEAALITRADRGSVKSNPKDATFDVTGWKDISEEDCYVMLCLKGGERTWQRIDTPGLNEVNYKESGAKAVPFRKDQVPKRHTGQINPNPGVKSETNSAEEFPWESMAQGGSGANLLPATRYQQNQQGNAIKTGFRRSEVNLGEWFRITFTGDLGPICQALQRDPPDTSICKNPEESLFGKKINLNNWVWYMATVGGSLVYYHAAGDSKGKVGKRTIPIETPTLHSEGYKFVEERSEVVKNGDLTPIISVDEDFENGELTEADLEIIKP